jgi:signal transduction histidine kinase
VSIGKLLNVIITASLIGILIVLASVVSMGVGVKNNVAHFLDTQNRLTVTLAKLYAQGLQKGQATRNIILNPNDEIAIQNYDKADRTGLYLINSAVKLSQIALEDPLLKVQLFFASEKEHKRIDENSELSNEIAKKLIELSALWKKDRALKEEVQKMAMAHIDIAQISTFVTNKELPIWREIKVKLEYIQAIQEQTFLFAHRSFDQKVNFGTYFIIAILLLAMVIIWRVVILVNARITQPLAVGVAFAEALSQKDFAQENIEVNRDDEFGQLFGSLNKMKKSLKSSIKALEVKSANLEFAHQGLEEMVTQRTHAFEEKNRELQRTLEVVNETQKQLVESEKMASLGGLVAGIAHEINTPIGIGVTAASHLEEKTNAFNALFAGGKMKKSDLAKYIEVAQKSTSSILNNLHTAAELITSFKKISIDQSSETVQKLELNTYFKEIIISLRPKLKKTGIEVKVICDESLVLKTYPGSISQLITNFIMNSLIHAFDETTSGLITLEAVAKEDRLLLRYSDNGKGIASEHLDKIFDPFFTTRRGSGGSGLGLNIIYNIVTQKLEGTIEVQSILGEGTTFNVDIPLEIKTDAIVL